MSVARDPASRDAVFGLLWRATVATCESEFDNAMHSLERLSAVAYHRAMEDPVHTWAVHAFPFSSFMRTDSNDAGLGTSVLLFAELGLYACPVYCLTALFKLKLHLCLLSCCYRRRLVCTIFPYETSDGSTGAVARHLPRCPVKVGSFVRWLLFCKYLRLSAGLFRLVSF